MRIDRIVNQRQPKQSTPKNLKELYERESTPGTKDYDELELLYDDNRPHPKPNHPSNFEYLKNKRKENATN